MKQWYLNYYENIILHTLLDYLPYFYNICICSSHFGLPGFKTVFFFSGSFPWISPDFRIIPWFVIFSHYNCYIWYVQFSKFNNKTFENNELASLTVPWWRYNQSNPDIFSIKQFIVCKFIHSNISNECSMLWILKWYINKCSTMITYFRWYFNNTLIQGFHVFIKYFRI